MHEDHDVNRHARRKDILSAEDLGIVAMVLEIRHVYLHERALACVNGPSNALLRLHRQSARYAAYGSAPSYRGKACQPLDLDLVDLEVKGQFPH